MSVGQAIQAMLLNSLEFVDRPQYLTPEFYTNKPVEALIGAGIRAEDLNDDGRVERWTWLMRLALGRYLHK